MATTKQKQTGRRSNIYNLLAGIGVFVLIAGFGFWWFFGGGNALLPQHKMKAYLEEKYGKEFVVENYRVEGSGLGVEGDPVADAWPKSEPDKKFMVYNLANNYKMGRYSYKDSYINTLLSDEQYPVLGGQIKDILGYMPNYEVTIGFGGTLVDYHKLPRFSELMRTQPENLSVQLKITSAQIKNSELWRVIDVLKQSKPADIRLTYCKPNSDSKSCIVLNDEKIENINSVEDLTSYMENKGGEK